MFGINVKYFWLLLFLVVGFSSFYLGSYLTEKTKSCPGSGVETKIVEVIKPDNPTSPLIKDQSAVAFGQVVEVAQDFLILEDEGKSFKILLDSAVEVNLTNFRDASPVVLPESKTVSLDKIEVGDKVSVGLQMVDGNWIGVSVNAVRE